MNTIHKNRKRGFTLLEIILVIAAIGILAAIVLVAINPNRQLAQVRNAERRSEINTIYKALEQYLIDKGSYPTGITTVVQDICNTGSQKSTDTLSPTTLCDNKADLRVLVPDYIAAIPIDPGGGTYRVVINTSNNRVSVYASNAELGQGIGINDRPWTPAQLGSSLALWLDASDASTITLNGSTVSQWNDKSGNGRHVSQATSSAQPAYVSAALNGKNGINFYLNKGLVNTGASMVAQFVCVVTKSQSGTWANYHTHIGSVGSPGRVGGIRESSNTGFDLFPGPSAVWEDGVSKTVSGSGFSSVDNPHVIGFTATAGKGNPMPGISIGNYDGNSTQGGAGFEYETVVLASVPTTATRQQIEGYLAWKWGLTNNLPANHPYKWNGAEFGGVNITDTDAQTYIAAVETADGQSLENNTRLAIQNFIVGAKADGIWDAIKSSNILAGARTLNGALVPLKGTAPTNFNFVSGDYNRKTGLVGNGSNKYLDSNRANNADPQDNHHLSIYATVNPGGSVSCPIGVSPSINFNSSGETDILFTSGSLWPFRSRAAAPLSGTSSLSTVSAVGFLGISRSTSSQLTGRAYGTNDVITQTSANPLPNYPAPNPFPTVTVFARNTEVNARNAFTSARLSFYSIGESLDLAKLDARVTALMNELTAAIP